MFDTAKFDVTKIKNIIIVQHNIDDAVGWNSGWLLQCSWYTIWRTLQMEEWRPGSAIFPTHNDHTCTLIIKLLYVYFSLVAPTRSAHFSKSDIRWRSGVSASCCIICESVSENNSNRYRRCWSCFESQFTKKACRSQILSLAFHTPSALRCLPLGPGLTFLFALLFKSCLSYHRLCVIY